MKKRLILILAVLFTINTNAQEHPFKIKWKKIKTEHFEIVFPEEISHEGQRMANTLEFLYEPVSLTLKEEPKKISVFLSNQSTVSNGYVSTIPRMSLFYTTPMQDATILGSQDWLETLAVHEFRHVVQNDLSNKRFSKLGSIFYGSYGRAGLAYSEPLWYSEGDAVVTETMYSQLGRGRIPAFTMPIKTQLLTQENFNYEQAYLGSFKKYSPSHYPLGYLMEMQMRADFGSDISNKTINRMSWYSFFPYAFSLAQKKETGKNARKMHQHVFEKYKTEWQAETDKITETKAKQITPTEKYHTNYYHPQQIGENIYAIKKGLAYPRTLIKIDKNGKEHKIKGISARKISASGSKITWASYAAHIRYQEKSYSNIFVYDTLTNKIKQITFGKRYFSPTLSPDLKTIACVEFSSDSKSKLLILNAITGEVFREFNSPNNDFLRTPAWSSNGKNIVFMHTSTKGQALSVLNIKTGKFKEIIPRNFKNISNPAFYKKYIVFNMPTSDVGNICAFDTLSKEIHQITSRKFGAYNANISNNQLVFQDYTVNGHKISISKINPALTGFKTLSGLMPDFYNNKLITEQLKSEDNTKILGKAIVPDSVYQIKKYRKLLNGINIHAWGIYPDEENVDFSINSNNKLNTISLTAGIKYNYASESFKKYAEAEYSALFPVFHASINSENQSVSFTKDNFKNTVNWKENYLASGIYFPFNFSKRNLSHYLSIGSYFQITDRIAQEGIGDYQIREGLFTPITGYFTYQIYKHSAPRDVAPRLGLYIKGIARNTPFEQEYEGSQKSFITKIYLPSPIKHHSIKLEGVLETQESDLTFSNNYVFPRGYEIANYNVFIKMSASYHFPLIHPDLNIISLAYIKRVRTNLFYDYGFAHNNVEGGNGSQTLQSVGAELWFDFNLFNIKYDFNAGLRYSYRLSDNKGIFDFVMFEIPIK